MSETSSWRLVPSGPSSIASAAPAPAAVIDYVIASRNEAGPQDWLFPTLAGRIWTSRNFRYRAKWTETTRAEGPFLEEIPDALDLTVHAEHYRIEYNTVRPHEAIAWNRPIEVHLGSADPAVPNFPEPQNLPSA